MMSWIRWAVVYSSIVNMTVKKQLPFVLLGVAENIPIKHVGVEKIDVVCAILMQLFKNVTRVSVTETSLNEVLRVA